MTDYRADMFDGKTIAGTTFEHEGGASGDLILIKFTDGSSVCIECMNGNTGTGILLFSSEPPPKDSGWTFDNATTWTTGSSAAASGLPWKPID